MRAFSFELEKAGLQIGLEFKGVAYNFSAAWEVYKKINNQGRGPSLPFLQLMVEADFLNGETFREVMDSLSKAGALPSLEIKQALKMAPPIGRPQKILCIGRNFVDHAAELGNPVPEEPIFFSKAPSSLLGHEGTILLPKDVGRVDFEGELAVVIGKRAQNVPEAKAMDHVAGFSIINDVTARDLQKKDTKAGKPWFRSKSFDSFCPFGPYLVPKDTISDYRQLVLKVNVNGELKQQGRFEDMIFDIHQLVAFLSRHCTLEPGDVIATGTPSGVGPLASGDVVECEIQAVGTLRNKVK